MRMAEGDLWVPLTCCQAERHHFTCPGSPVRLVWPVAGVRLT